MKAFIAYVYPIKYQPSAFHLAHKIQQPIQKIQIQILTNFLTNLNKFYYSCFAFGTVLVFQHQNFWLKDLGKFRIRNWLLAAVREIIIIRDLLI